MGDIFGRCLSCESIVNPLPCSSCTVNLNIYSHSRLSAFILDGKGSEDASEDESQALGRTGQDEPETKYADRSRRHLDLACSRRGARVRLCIHDKNLSFRSFPSLLDLAACYQLRAAVSLLLRLSLRLGSASKRRNTDDGCLLPPPARAPSDGHIIPSADVHGFSSRHIDIPIFTTVAAVFVTTVFSASE